MYQIESGNTFFRQTAVRVNWQELKKKILGAARIFVPIVLLYGGLCLVLSVLQRSLIYFPNPRVNTAVDFIELEREDATIRISVLLVESDRCVIYFGGNAEDVSLALNELSMVFPNCSIYAMNYRGYGGSTGSPSEVTLKSDAKALYDLVKQTHSEVILVGRSLGSGLAVPLGAECEVHRCVLLTPFDSLVNVAKYHYPFLPVNRLMVDRYESHLIASRVRAPVFVLIAESDQVVPRNSTVNLIRSFAPGKCWSMVMKGTDHNSLSLPVSIVQQFVSDPQSMPTALQSPPE